MAGQSAQNFLHADSLQSESKEGNVIVNAPPIVPGSLLHSPAFMKYWHQSVPQDLREMLVEKILQVIFPIEHVSTLQDPRMDNLFAYARKVEGHAFGAANSKEEYFQLLAKKIHKFQLELDEKRQKRKEMQLQKNQLVDPGSRPMIGNYTAASSPVNGQALERLHIQTQQFARNLQNSAQLKSFQKNSETGAMTGQSAQNFLHTNSLQSEAKGRNCVLVNDHPPVAPGSLLHNPAFMKYWHQSIPQDLREKLVEKIIQFILPNTETSTLQDPRMANLAAYARKVEGHMYGIANSREEYYQLIAEKVHRIQRELIEKRQERKIMQLQKIQEIHPNSGTMNGNNTAASNTMIDQASPSLDSLQALINVSPDVPGGLLDNINSMKDWHQSVSQDLRLYFVQKMFHVIFPTTVTSVAFQDPKIVNIYAYARKVEGQVYSAANSREEYYQMLAEKLQKITVEIEEKQCAMIPEVDPAISDLTKFFEEMKSNDSIK